MVILASMAYFLIVEAKTTTTVASGQNGKTNTAYFSRMFLGGIIGFALGAGIDILLHPPSKGIWQTSSHDQGPILLSWIMCGGIGAIFLAFAGFLSLERRRGPIAPLAVLLSPIACSLLVFLWAFVISPYTQYGNNWAIYPVLLAAFVIIGLHVFLVVLPRNIARWKLVIYGICHLTLFSQILLFALMLISKDGL